MKRSGDFMKLSDVAIYHETAGEGPPLVFIHGFSLDSRMWDSQFSFFSKRSYQTVRYDVRGFGRSVPAGE